MRKILATLAVAGSGIVSALAEGETPAVDTTAASNAATAIKTGLVSILEALGPLVLAVVVAGVGIWAIPRIVGVLKSGFTSGKGR